MERYVKGISIEMQFIGNNVIRAIFPVTHAMSCTGMPCFADPLDPPWLSAVPGMS
jgi:hypothetical protein